MQDDTASLLDKISASEFVPRTFLSEVCANSLVDSWEFSTFAIEITGLNTL